MRCTLIVAVLTLSLGLVSIVAAQEQSPERPLPDVASLWRGLKPHLMAQYEETELLKGYTYQRTSYISEFGKSDSVKKTNVVRSEVYYFEHGPFIRVTSVNGVPLPLKEVQKQDAAFEKFRKKGSSGGPPWKRGRTRSPKEQEELLNDVFNAFDFTVLRREMRAGRSTIIVDFKPRKDPKLETKLAKLFFPNLEGTAWVDEMDHVLVKVETRAQRDIKFGLGLIVRVDDDTKLSREWLKVNDEVWLPQRRETRLKGRAFVAKGINLRDVEEFSDYKKFSVETTIKLNEDEH